MRALLLLAGASVLIGLKFAWAEQPAEAVLSTAHQGPVDLLRYDARAERLFIVQGNELSVLTVTGARIGSISFDHAVTGLALAVDLGKGLVVIEESSALALVDLKNVAVEKTFFAEVQAPATVVFDSASGQFFAASSRNPGLLAINPDSGVQTRIDTHVPIAALSANGRGWVFAAAKGEPEVYLFNSLGGADLGIFPAPGCSTPSSLAVDDAERRLYLACANGRLVVLDSDTGVVLSTQEIAPGPAAMELRMPGNRVVQAIIAVHGSNVTVSEGQITASAVRDIYEGLGNGAALAADPRSSRVFLATGPTVTVMHLE